MIKSNHYLAFVFVVVILTFIFIPRLPSSALSNVIFFSRLPRHAHGLACIQAFAHWLELLNLESKRQNNDSAEKVKSMVVTILEGTLPLLQSTVRFLFMKFRYINEEVCLFICCYQFV